MQRYENKPVITPSMEVKVRQEQTTLINCSQFMPMVPQSILWMLICMAKTQVCPKPIKYYRMGKIIAKHSRETIINRSMMTIHIQVFNEDLYQHQQVIFPRIMNITCRIMLVMTTIPAPHITIKHCRMGISIAKHSRVIIHHLVIVNYVRVYSADLQHHQCIIHPRVMYATCRIMLIKIR